VRQAQASSRHRASGRQGRSGVVPVVLVIAVVPSSSVSVGAEPRLSYAFVTTLTVLIMPVLRARLAPPISIMVRRRKAAEHAS